MGNALAGIGKQKAKKVEKVEVSNTEDADKLVVGKMSSEEKLDVGKQRMLWRVFGNPHELGKRMRDHDIRKSPS